MLLVCSPAHRRGVGPARSSGDRARGASSWTPLTGGRGWFGGVTRLAAPWSRSSSQTSYCIRPASCAVAATATCHESGDPPCPWRRSCARNLPTLRTVADGGRATALADPAAYVASGAPTASSSTPSTPGARCLSQGGVRIARSTLVPERSAVHVVRCHDWARPGRAVLSSAPAVCVHAVSVQASVACRCRSCPACGGKLGLDLHLDLVGGGEPRARAKLAAKHRPDHDAAGWTTVHEVPAASMPEVYQGRRCLRVPLRRRDLAHYPSVKRWPVACRSPVLTAWRCRTCCATPAHISTPRRLRVDNRCGASAAHKPGAAPAQRRIGSLLRPGVHLGAFRRRRRGLPVPRRSGGVVIRRVLPRIRTTVTVVPPPPQRSASA